jgi:hypothetical protein
MKIQAHLKLIFSRRKHRRYIVSYFYDQHGSRELLSARSFRHSTQTPELRSNKLRALYWPLHKMSITPTSLHDLCRWRGNTTAKKSRGLGNSLIKKIPPTVLFCWRFTLYTCLFYKMVIRVNKLDNLRHTNAPMPRCEVRGHVE